MIYTFKDGFDDWRQELPYPYSGQIVTDEQLGQKVARFEVRQGENDQWGHNRAEISRPDLKATPGQEIWYSFKMLIEPGVEQSRFFCIPVQWHATRDKDAGEVHRSPPLSLWMQNGELKLITRYSDVPVMDDNDDGVTVIEQWSGPVQEGVWSDWLFRVLWTHESGGILQAWRDDVQIVDYGGPTMYNDERGPKPKIGAYRSTNAPGTFVSRFAYYGIGYSRESVTPAPPQTPRTIIIGVSATITIEVA